MILLMPMRQGMNDYLTKPVVPGVMFRTLAMWLKQ